MKSIVVILAVFSICAHADHGAPPEVSDSRASAPATVTPPVLEEQGDLFGSWRLEKEVKGKKMTFNFTLDPSKSKIVLENAKTPPKFFALNNSVASPIFKEAGDKDSYFGAYILKEGDNTRFVWFRLGSRKDEQGNISVQGDTQELKVIRKITDTSFIVAEDKPGALEITLTKTADLPQN